MEELTKFIRDSIKQGFSKEEIKNKLLEEDWSSEEIDSAFAIPLESSKARGTILKIIALWLIASVILLFSIAVLRYELGIIDYTIIDPVTGESLGGYCSDPSCSEVKQSALTQVKNNLTIDIIIAVFLSLAISLIYLRSHHKKTVLWVINGLFFIFVIVNRPMVFVCRMI